MHPYRCVFRQTLPLLSGCVGNTNFRYDVMKPVGSTIFNYDNGRFPPCSVDFCLWKFQFTFRFHIYLYWWSIWAFSIRLSFARRFWNQILICVSLRRNATANSERLVRDTYSADWNSISRRSVCSWVNVVLWRRWLSPLRFLLATVTQQTQSQINKKQKVFVKAVQHEIYIHSPI